MDEEADICNRGVFQSKRGGAQCAARATDGNSRVEMELEAQPMKGILLYHAVAAACSALIIVAA